jgi:hypothetical protein
MPYSSGHPKKEKLGKIIYYYNYDGTIFKKIIKNKLHNK